MPTGVMTTGAALTIPMSAPDLGEHEIAAVVEVLRSGTLSLGPMLAGFEASVAEYVGAGHAVAVSSGTAGLHLAVRAAGIRAGEEVITTPFSFVASANCILYEGGRPVFVDIDPDTLNLDPALIEKRITDRTKAILPVHVFGRPCAMDAILTVAQRHGLAVIEDAAEAFGAVCNGKKVGTLGDLGVYAFYPNKQMTTGEGGMVVTDSEAYAGLVRSLRNQGRDNNAPWLTHRHLGYNYRLNELSCALGLAQLERIDELLAKRERVARVYTERLSAVPGVQVPCHVPGMSWFVYVVRLAEGIDRDAVMARLAAEGIPSRAYFPPIHLQPYMRELGYGPGDCPVAESVARSTLALPFHGNLGEAEIDYVCRALTRILNDRHA